PEIDEAETPVGQHQQVARMGISVEATLLEDLGQYLFEGEVGDSPGGIRLCLRACTIDRQRLARELLHHQRVLRAPLPVHLRDADPGIASQAPPERVERRGFASEIDLGPERRPEVSQRARDGEAGRLPKEPGNLEQGIEDQLDAVQVTVDLTSEAWAYQLDDHPAAAR